MRAAASLSWLSAKPICVAIEVAISLFMPSIMSTGILMIAVGSAAAISSIEVPPTLLPIIIGPPLPRSITMAKYFSVAMDTFSASIRVLFGLPFSPVC